MAIESLKNLRKTVSLLNSRNTGRRKNSNGRDSRHKSGDWFWTYEWVFWSQQDHEIEPFLSLDNCADFNPNVCAIPKVRDNIRHSLQKLIVSLSRLNWVSSSILGSHKNIGGVDFAYNLIPTFCSWSNIWLKNCETLAL